MIWQLSQTQPHGMDIDPPSSVDSSDPRAVADALVSYCLRGRADLALQLSSHAFRAEFSETDIGSCLWTQLWQGFPLAGHLRPASRKNRELREFRYEKTEGMLAAWSVGLIEEAPGVWRVEELVHHGGRPPHPYYPPGYRSSSIK
jgi:hypothetical protein